MCCSAIMLPLFRALFVYVTSFCRTRYTVYEMQQACDCPFSRKETGPEGKEANLAGLAPEPAPLTFTIRGGPHKLSS